MLKLTDILENLLREDVNLVALQKSFDDAWLAWKKDQKNIRLKRSYDQAAKDLTKYKKGLEQKSLNIPELKKIFQSFGLSAASYQHSSVPGFRRASPETYEFPDKNNLKIIWLHTSPSKIQDITNAMKEAGFDIQNQNSNSITLR